MLRRNFDVEHADVILGHNVEWRVKDTHVGARVLKINWRGWHTQKA